jgi:hypothetical protein
MTEQHLLYFGTVTLSFLLSNDTFSLDLIHQVLLELLDILRRGIFHRLLGGLDLGTVLSVLGVGSTGPIPPAEGGGVVVGEGHVVEVVMLGTRPEGDDVVQRPGEVVARVRVDGLEKAEDDPEVDGDDVEVLGEVAVDEGAENGACAEDENLSGMGVFSGKTEGRRVLVMDLVDVSVQRAVVEGLVGCKFISRCNQRS